MVFGSRQRVTAKRRDCDGAQVKVANQGNQTVAKIPTGLGLIAIIELLVEPDPRSFGNPRIQCWFEGTEKSWSCSVNDTVRVPTSV